MALPKRHAPVATSAEVLAQLKAIRSRRAMLRLLVATCLPCYFLLDAISKSVDAEWTFAAFWMALTLTVGARTVLSRCPICGLRFFPSEIGKTLFARRCYNCGQEL